MGWTVYRPRSRCFSAVVNANLIGRNRRRLASQEGRTCRDENGFQFGRSPFAVAGRDALWVLSEAGNDVYDHVIHGSAGRRDRELDLFQYSGATYDGDHLGELAGAGKTLIYGWYHVVITDDSCIEGGGDCRFAVDNGSVRRIVNRRPVGVSGAPAAYLVATNGPTVALVTAHGETTRFGVPLDRRDVEVRQVKNGRLLSSFRVGRNVLDLALGDDVVAVLRGPRLRVERRQASSGNLIGSTLVPRETVSINASGSRLVLVAGWRIYLLDLGTGQLRLVTETHVPPIGASVAGNRVSWAETNHRHGVVRSLTVP
ncbi:MAG: hypothetical protein QOI67_597 [Gaiellaceae bacterium]|nr:hypothetical protein [Gaiellaceae bacterium]